MTQNTRNTVKKYILNSYNANQNLYNMGCIPQEIYDILLHLSDKLAFRSNSYWQEKIHARYGFTGLVDRINKIRDFWGLDCMDIDYSYYNSKKSEMQK